MSDSTVRTEIEKAIGEDYLIEREQPATGGLPAFGGIARANRTPVAIKAISMGDLQRRSPPLNEAALAARRLRHPNVLPIIESGVSGDTFYWISPSIDARTLRARLGRTCFEIPVMSNATPLTQLPYCLL